MVIRRAEEKDVSEVLDLLLQVLTVHNNIRPDLFKANSTKYTSQELLALFGNDFRPVFVYENDENKIEGYCFCVIEQHFANNVLTDIKTLYIDDLCVDENCRGKGVGHKLYDYVRNYAKEIGCYNVTLNVWEGNENAISFYRKLGLKPYKYGMESIL